MPEHQSIQAPVQETIADDTEDILKTEELQVAQASPYEDNQEMDKEQGEDSSEAADTEAEEDEEYLPGYDTESDWKMRLTGSASLITDKTVIISIFVDEEEDVWTPEEKQIMLKNCRIGYSFIADYLKDNYKADVDLIYDWEENPDLVYTLRIYESISPYVTTEEERHIDELELELTSQVPYRDLMLQYDATSVAFLYFVPHEGCSYSSMHFVEDGDYLWNESCLLYLQDMYSPEYDYETPTTFAHELLHLFGAEDFYDSDVFSKETYKKLAENCSDDLMYQVYDKINGVYTIYHDEVKKEISPVTAYLLGVGSKKDMEDYPELIRDDAGCFPGSTFDRPF